MTARTATAALLLLALGLLTLSPEAAFIVALGGLIPGLDMLDRARWESRRRARGLTDWRMR